MTRRSAPRAGDVVLATGVAILAALVMGLGLAAASRPAHFGERQAALADQVEQIRRLTQRPAGGTAYSPDALCRGDPAAASRALHDNVTTSATRSNVSVEFLEVHPETASGEGQALIPIRLKFTVTGSYENVVAVLASLSQQRPDVFADGVDLTPKTSTVTASFSGRAFCAV